MRYTCLLHKFLRGVFFLFFFIAGIQSLHAQKTYKVTYSIKEIKIQGSLDNLDNNGRQLFEDVVDYAKKINYILIANQEESHFKQENTLINESNTPLERFLSRAAQRFTSFNEMVYANHNVDSIVFVRNILNQDFIVKRGYFNFNWVFKKEAKKILGFDAMKAEGSYYHPVTNKELKVEAWFIPSIPVQSGPDIFMGLPGLIAEVNLQGALVMIKKIEQNANFEIKKIDDSTAKSQTEFEDLIKNLNKKYENYIND